MEITKAVWKTFDTVKFLQKYFSKHVIGLYISCEIGNEISDYVYSGVLVVLEDQLYFLTAGHVVKHIDDDMKKVGEKLVFRWVEGECKDETETIPATIVLGDLFYIDDNEYDFGFIKIDYFSSRCILKSNILIPVDKTIWENVQYSKPEFYYVLGMPSETNSKQVRLINEKYYLKNDSIMFCFPVEIIPYNDDLVNKKKFKKEEDYYGKIYSNFNGQAVISSIVGMSGGPLFSVEFRNNELVYRLFGILESWDESKQIIRVQNINEIIRYFTNRENELKRT